MSDTEFQRSRDGVLRLEAIGSISFAKSPYALTSQVDIARVATPDAIAFLDRVIQRYPPDGGKWASVIRRFVEEIGKGIRSDGGNPDSWDRWSNFIIENRSFCSEEAFDDWYDEAQTFCRNYPDVIYENRDLHSDAEDRFEQLKSTAKTWGFALVDEEKTFKEWMSNRDSDDDANDEWDGRSSGSNPNEGLRSTNGDLDNLFGSLAHRDRDT